MKTLIFAAPAAKGLNKNISALYCKGQVWRKVDVQSLKVIYHPLYGMNNYVLIWGDWLSCDPLRGSHDSQPPHIRKLLCLILRQLLFIFHKIIHTI